MSRSRSRRRTVTHGTESSNDGIEDKTTRIRSVTDENGNSVYEETFVYNGSGFDLMTATKHTYSGNHLVETERDGIVIYEAAYTGGLLTSETDETGMETTYAYNDAKQLASRTLEGATDIVTTYTYDTEGRTISESVSAGVLSQTSSNVYDSIGRIASRTDASGVVTSTEYSNNGLTTTTISPGGVTQIADSYLDGQGKSVTGTGVIASFSHFGTEGAYTQFSEERVLEDTQTRYTTTTVDGMGRVVSMVTPKFGGGTRTETKEYNSLGQLLTETRTGFGDITYTYADPFTQTRTDDADPDSDIVTTTVTTYAEVSSHAHAADGWYRVSSVTTGTGGDETISISKSQISGLARDSIQIDGEASESVSHTAVNRGTKTVTDYGYSTGISNPSVSTTINGLLTSTQSPSQPEATTYEYDALQRPTTVVSPETGTTTSVYNEVTGLLDSVLQHASCCAGRAYYGRNRFCVTRGHRIVSTFHGSSWTGHPLTPKRPVRREPRHGFLQTK